MSSRLQNSLHTFSSLLVSWLLNVVSFRFIMEMAMTILLLLKLLVQINSNSNYFFINTNCSKINQICSFLCTVKTPNLPVTGHILQKFW